MSESLRDRVARVLDQVDQEKFATGLGHYPNNLDYADALIAAGLVAGGGETPSTAFEVMATRHGLPIMLHHGAHDNPLRVRSWTHDGDRILVEYVEVTS